ncbi:hypothetical protein DERF_001985 [Dermatophagoides farinae]|uniref:Uncharacterized protein n=1 Tax=Dermatophagoides farinae TaxID=6954 RepID=A0A922LD60_DERFA|nr:hypothetical protein DERF_001985 [Dermatophagoides farinae]
MFALDFNGMIDDNDNDSSRINQCPIFKPILVEMANHIHGYDDYHYDDVDDFFFESRHVVVDVAIVVAVDVVVELSANDNVASIVGVPLIIHLADAISLFTLLFPLFPVQKP